ncbi:ABC transporter substrate-binding protein [Afifella sp. IM 167]|uniref:ABC transporter substrate-binding protein n=1 Tax=Afifella sp. IM 167 TaxID=2033586 RepID=UPI001CCB8F62|nr:ABC transporter substrate-binding protein [Afifella sp. IM 167]
MVTRRLFCAAAGLGLLAATTLSAPAVAQDKLKVNIGVAGFHFVPYMPIILARELGMFEKAGLDAELVSINGGSLVATALIGGSIDVASGYYEHTITFASKGKDVRAIVLTTKLPGMALYVAPPSFDEVKTVKDLAGKSVGVTSPGSATDFLLKYILRKDGVDENSVSIVAVGGPASTIAAAEQGQVAAVVNGEPSITPLQMKDPDRFRILADTRTEEGTKELFGGEYPAASLYARAEWIDSHQEEARRLAKAMVMTLRWMHSHTTQEWVDTMPADIVGENPEQYLQIINNMQQIFSETGRIEPEAAEHPFELLKESVPELASADVDLANTYTNEFADAANKELGTQ